MNQKLTGIQEDITILIKKYLECKDLCGSLVLTHQEASVLGIDPLSLTITVSHPSIPIIALPDTPSPLQLFPSGNPSPLQPTFSEYTVDHLFTILLSPNQLESRWKDLQDLFPKIFGMTLGPYNKREVEKIKEVLRIAAGTKSSDHQICAALSFLLLTRPEKFLTIPRNIYPLSQWAAIYAIAKEILEEGRPQVKEKETEHVWISPETLYQEPIHIEADTPTSLMDIDIPPAAPVEKATSDAEKYAQSVVSLLQPSSPLERSECGQFMQDVHDIATKVEAKATKEEEHVEMFATIEETEQKCMQHVHSLACPAQSIVATENLQACLEKLAAESAITKEAKKNALRKIQTILGKRLEASESLMLQTAGEAAGYINRPTVQQAIFALVDPFPEGFLRLNPALTIEDAQELRKEVIQYLMHKSYQNDIQKALRLIRKFDSKSKQAGRISEDLIKEFDALLTSKRGYAVSSHPEYLVFESVFGHFLRDEQIKVISGFLSGESKAKEIIMGWGKSAVLIPIISHIIAQRHKIAIVILTKPLFPSMAPKMAASLQQSFSDPAYSWNLSPDTAVSLETLRAIESTLDNAQEGHGTIFLRPNDFLGLFLQFITTIEDKDSFEKTEKIHRFQSIFSKIQTNAEVLIDEVDSVWDVLKENGLLLFRMKKANQSPILDSGTNLSK